MREGRKRRPLTLALEMVYASDQQLLDAFLEGRIGERLFLERTRHVTDWGYPWRPMARLLRAARARGVRCLALDIAPRGSASDLALRDRIFADRLAAELSRSAEGRVIAIVGEAHLATDYLPRRLEADCGVAAGRVFANVESGVCQADGGRRWLMADDGVAGAFPCQPGDRLSALARTYRRWASSEADPAGSDRTMMAHSLMDALAAAAGVDPRRTRLGPGRWLADRRPMVWGVEQISSLRRWASAAGIEPEAVAALHRRALAQGAAWSASTNLLLVAPRGLAALPLACARAVVDGLGRGVSPEGDGGAGESAPAHDFDGPARADDVGHDEGTGPRGRKSVGRSSLDWRRVAREALATSLARHADPRLGAPAWGEARIETVLGGWLGEALSVRAAEGRLPASRLRRWLRRPPQTPAAGLLRVRAMTRACG